jgi:CheY-like chemotaxis protein
MNILVVDDTSLNRKLIGCLLQDYPCTLHYASDGFAAIDTFKKQCMDIVLMDIQMPVISGFQTTRAMRYIEEDQGRKCTTPIIAVTAYFDEDECIQNGMDGYVNKPVSRQALVDAIEKVFPGNASECQKLPG